MTIIAIAISLLAVFTFIWLVGEGAGLLTYGKYLSDKESIPFLEKHLNKYSINSISWESGKKMLGEYENNLPYIAEQRQSFFASWHIEGYGQISRWSEASKMIDNYFDSLDKPPLKAKLSDL